MQLQEKMVESKAAIKRTETLVAEEDVIVAQLRQQMKQAKEAIRQSLGTPVPPPPRQLRKRRKRKRSTKPAAAGAEPPEQQDEEEEADEDSDEGEDTRSPPEKSSQRH